MTRMTRIFKAALYIPAYHTEGKKNPRHPCHPCLKDYLHAEGEPCSSATLVNYHLCTNLFFKHYFVFWVFLRFIGNFVSRSMTSKGISLCLMAKSDLITSFLMAFYLWQNMKIFSEWKEILDVFFVFLEKRHKKRLFSLDKWRNCINFVLEKRQAGAFVV